MKSFGFAKSCFYAFVVLSAGFALAQESQNSQTEAEAAVVSESASNPQPVQTEKSTDQSLSIQRILSEAENYLYGDGVPMDLVKAAALYEKAAGMGSAKAQMRLATLYRRGNGVEKNPQKSFELLKAAAESGYAPAQMALGAAYRDGIGVEKSEEAFRRWIGKAADNGHVMAMIMQVELLNGSNDPQKEAKIKPYLDNVQTKATPQELYSIGYSYFHGLRLPKDLDKSMYWTELAAQKGEINAMHLLGQSHWNKNNFVAALSWFEKAAEKGLPQAQLQTGRIYRDGAEGVKPDAVKAVKWLSKSADFAEQQDLFTLMLLLHTGPKKVRNPVAAQQVLEKFLAKAPVEQLQDLAEIYWKGQGVRRNFDLGGAFALAAVQKGDMSRICDFALKLSTPNWVRSDYITGYALLNQCLLNHQKLENYTDLKLNFEILQSKMKPRELQAAQNLDPQDALADFLATHKPQID